MDKYITTDMRRDILKTHALKLYQGMVTVWPQLNGQEYALDLSHITPKFTGRYAVNNSTVSFVLEGEVYSAPSTSLLVSTLLSLGFRYDHFNVPFSNGDYPKREKDFWNLLRQKAQHSYEVDFAEDCKKYCDEHHIRPISDEALKKCFKMPKEGVWVKHPSFEDCYFPILNTTCFTDLVANKLGRYCINNGKVVFVYRDGKTYVTKGSEVLHELRSKGYIETGLFVPFSNGETITNPAMKNLWDSLPKD